MPLWQIHHHPGAFTAEQKQGLSKAITEIYSDKVGLPEFYAIVIFEPNECIFRGGKVDPKFVRITFTQLARYYPEEEKQARGFQQLVDAALKPWIADQGLSWEYNYVFEPRLYWKIDGLIPPPANSEEEKLWKQENKAIPY